MKESDLQIICINWFRLQYPEYANLITHIPNGELRDRKTKTLKSGKTISYSPAGVKAKRMGAVAGYPDLILFVPSQSYHGLFIEMTRKGEKPTDKQKAIHSALIEQAYSVVVADTFEAFVEQIKRYLK